MDGTYIFQDGNDSRVPLIYSHIERQIGEIVVQKECPREEGLVRIAEDEPNPLVKYMAGVIGIEL